MKMPDKLYLSPVIYGAVTNLSPNPDCEGEIEYVRKDAILELLQGMIQSCKTKNGFPAGTLAAVRIETLEVVISQIEEICKEETK